MFRLRYVLALMTNAVIVGSLLILVLSLGWVGWVPVFGAIAVGFLLSWPAARILARWIKAEDPAWNEALDRPGRRRAALPEAPGPGNVADRSAARGAAHRLAGRRSQFSRPAWRIAPRIRSLVASSSVTIGDRTSSVHLPSSDSANLVGAGFGSANAARCSGISRS